jgi:hypothetical protein
MVLQAPPSSNCEPVSTLLILLLIASGISRTITFAGILKTPGACNSHHLEEQNSLANGAAGKDLFSLYPVLQENT